MAALGQLPPELFSQILDRLNKIDILSLSSVSHPFRRTLVGLIAAFKQLTIECTPRPSQRLSALPPTLSILRLNPTLVDLSKLCLMLSRLPVLKKLVLLAADGHCNWILAKAGERFFRDLPRTLTELTVEDPYQNSKVLFRIEFLAADVPTPPGTAVTEDSPPPHEVLDIGLGYDTGFKFIPADRVASVSYRPYLLNLGFRFLFPMLYELARHFYNATQLKLLRPHNSNEYYEFLEPEALQIARLHALALSPMRKLQVLEFEVDVYQLYGCTSLTASAMYADDVDWMRMQFISMLPPTLSELRSVSWEASETVDHMQQRLKKQKFSGKRFKGQVDYVRKSEQDPWKPLYHFQAYNHSIFRQPPPRDLGWMDNPGKGPRPQRSRAPGGFYQAPDIDTEAIQAIILSYPGGISKWSVCTNPNSDENYDEHEDCQVCFAEAIDDEEEELAGLAEEASMLSDGWRFPGGSWDLEYNAGLEIRWAAVKERLGVVDGDLSESEGDVDMMDLGQRSIARISY